MFCHTKYYLYDFFIFFLLFFWFWSKLKPGHVLYRFHEIHLHRHVVTSSSWFHLHSNTYQFQQLLDILCNNTPLNDTASCGWKSVIKFSFLQAGSVYELLSVSWQLPHSYLETGEFWKWAEISVLEGSRRMESLCQSVQDELNAPIVQVSSNTETHYCLLQGGDVFLWDTLPPYWSLMVPVDSAEKQP